jgi:hypothetical protein
MPVCLAYSNVFPVVTTEPATTESKEAYVDHKSYATESPRPYRTQRSAEQAQVINQPPTVLSELESLTARLEAIRQPKAAIADIAASVPHIVDSATPAQKPWEGGTYDTFAQYAGEAARVRSTGRLPFGSDNKKIAL